MSASAQGRAMRACGAWCGVAEVVGPAAQNGGSSESKALYAAVEGMAFTVKIPKWLFQITIASAHYFSHTCCQKFIFIDGYAFFFPTFPAQ